MNIEKRHCEIFDKNCGNLFLKNEITTSLSILVMTIKIKE